MAIAPETIQMETVIAWETQSKTTEFRFKWLNFSMSEDDRLVFGDVFKIQAFFTGLYGDGTLQLVYAAGYTVLGVSPSPDRQNDDQRTLEWFRSQDFLSGKPGVTLASDSSSSVYGDWMQPSVWFWILTVAALASFSGFYLVWRRKSKTSSIGSSAVEQFLLESDEEKVIKFIKSSGGSINQSGISEQFGFSKAKTSQLLASLERKSIVARYKRGRDKIVNLIEQTAGDKS
jgi:hypothetical protein